MFWLDIKRLGWGARIRTWEWRYQKPLPYHLATPQCAGERRYRRRARAWQPACRVPGGRRAGALWTAFCGRPAPLPSIPFGRSAFLPLRPGGPAAISRSPDDNRLRSVAQSGSAPRSGRGGRRFKSCHSDHSFPVLPHLSRDGPRGSASPRRMTLGGSLIPRSAPRFPPPSWC